MNFDIELLGDCDVIVNEILLRLEERRRSRMETATAAASGNGENATEKHSDDTIEWGDICKEKNLLTKVEGAEAEGLIFSTSENR